MRGRNFRAQAEPTPAAGTRDPIPISSVEEGSRGIRASNVVPGMRLAGGSVNHRPQASSNWFPSRTAQVLF